MSTSLIKIAQLTKRYGNSTALSGVEIEIQRGQVYGIIGTSGAGKSTLFRCLTALERPTSGEIWIEGEEISKYSKDSLRLFRRKVGMIFQHFNLFSSRTVLENICYPLEIASVPKVQREKRALEWVDFVGLRGKELLYPAQLSGGQKQRVAIARALSVNPSILLCDEATSALDPTTTRQILELLRELNRSLHLTIVFITHEMEVVKEICTHISVLDKGRVVEAGEVANLFTMPQHLTTKKFLGALHHEPPFFSGEKEKSEILRLSFRGESTHKPIISQIIKKYNVEINILLGSIDKLVTENVGNLIVEMVGSQEEREKVHRFLRENHIHKERL